MAGNRAAAVYSPLKTNNSEAKAAVSWHDGQLTYISLECTSIPRALIKSYAGNTRRLDLSFNTLKNLDGLEQFSRLEELILDNNRLDDSTVFYAISTLHTLSLNKNNLKDLEVLLNKILVAYPNLTYLSLLGNEACPNQLSSVDKDDEDYQRYRYYVLYKLPKLRFLDSSPVKQRELHEARRIGCYMKIVRPANDLLNHSEIPHELRSAYSPLPPTSSLTGSHSGAYGKCRYRYSGKHSEGNRFIRNSDL